MYIVFVAVAAVVVFAVAAAAVGRGDGLEEPFPDLARPYLPDGRIEPVDIDDAHFAVAFRGYRMDQVDAVLDRIAAELVKRDQHISRLERIVHAQTVQSATAYTAPRHNRLGLGTAPMPRLRSDTGPLPAVEPDPWPPAGGSVAEGAPAPVGPVPVDPASGGPAPVEPAQENDVELGGHPAPAENSAEAPRDGTSGERSP